MTTSTLQWTEKASYPYASSLDGARSIFYNDQFLVFGGGDSHDTDLYTLIAAYNPTTNVWSQLGNLNNKRFDATGNDRVFSLNLVEFRIKISIFVKQ